MKTSVEAVTLQSMLLVLAIQDGLCIVNGRVHSPFLLGFLYLGLKMYYYIQTSFAKKYFFWLY